MSCKNFSDYKLGELVDISSSKRIYAKEYLEHGIPFYRGKEIIEKHKGNDISTELYISEERYNELKEKFGVPNEGDILLTSVGTLGVPYLVKNEEFYFKDGNLTWFKSFNEKCDNKYIYYWLQSPFAREQIYNKSIGSTQKALTIETLKKFEIKLPSLKEQRKIVNILSSLDKKIEINNEMNKTLEEMAQALFKRWLVDFEFPNEEGKPYKSSGGEMIESDMGMIPKGWNVVELNDVCKKITDGSHYSPKHFEEGLYPMLSVKDMREYDFDYKACKYIDDKEFEKMLYSDCVPKKNDILVAKDGSYLKHIFIVNEEEEQAILSSIAIFRPDEEKIYPEYLLYLLKNPKLQREVRENYVSGSALPRIVLKDFKKLNIILPPLKIQYEIVKILLEFKNKIYNNCKQNRELSNIRDCLLPKLMSGKIRVNDIGANLL